MTRAEAIPAMRDDDTRLIEKLRRRNAELDRRLDEVTADRDQLLDVLARVATALRLPEGIDPDKLVARIEELL